MSNSVTPEQLSIREELKKQYPYLIDRNSLSKDASGLNLGSKNIKRILKHHFPNCIFSVKVDKYAGGATIRASWIEFEPMEGMKELADILKTNFASTRFSGVDDSTHYDNDARRKEFRYLFGGAPSVSIRGRSPTPEERAEWEKQTMEANTQNAKSKKRGLRM